MKPIEIVESIRAKEPALMEGLTDRRAENLIKAALALVKDALADLEDGDLQVVMLGRFRMTETMKGEGKDAYAVRRIVYLPPKPIDKAAHEEQLNRAAARAAKSGAGKPGAKKAAKPDPDDDDDDDDSDSDD